jgi:hypothetical protein
VQEAIGYYERALPIAQEIGDRRGEASRSWNLGLLYEETDPVEAVALMSVLVQYERDIGHPDAEAHEECVARIQARLAGARRSQSRESSRHSGPSCARNTAPASLSPLVRIR